MKKHRKELLELAAVFGLTSKQEIGSNMHFVIPDRIDGKCNQLQLSALACNRKLAKNLSSLHYGDRNWVKKQIKQTINSIVFSQDAYGDLSFSSGAVI